MLFGFSFWLVLVLVLCANYLDHLFWILEKCSDTPTENQSSARIRPKIGTSPKIQFIQVPIYLFLKFWLGLHMLLVWEKTQVYIFLNDKFGGQVGVRTKEP